VKRRCLDILAGLSLVLWLAAAGLWVRSYWVGVSRHRIIDSVTDTADSYQFSSANGGLAMARGQSEYSHPNAEEAARVRQRSGYSYDNTYRVGWMDVGWRRFGGALRQGGAPLWLGFGYRSYDTRDSGIAQPLQVGWTVVVPWALPFVVFGVGPGWWMVRRARERRRDWRRRLGLCLACGYDLRASRERCPECGMAIAAGGREERTIAN
jgi:predicted RNA-binding Zn-ribbon protein involved in translation (DUF1610 family)